MNSYTNQSIDRLLHAITLLKDEEECRNFFSDLCTINELKDMGQRLDVAVMLREGKSYQDIVQAVGTSTATISRVRNCLDYGPGGYTQVLDRLEEEGKEEEKNADK